MTAPEALRVDTDGGIKPAICRRPRAALRQTHTLFVVRCKPERYHSVILSAAALGLFFFVFQPVFLRRRISLITYCRLVLWVIFDKSRYELNIDTAANTGIIKTAGMTV